MSSGAGLRDAYLGQIDGEDFKVWERSYGGERWDSAEAVLKTNDGGYVLAGYSASFGHGDWDVYVFKVDEDGHRIWENTYGTAAYDWAEDIAPSNDGGFIVVGNSESPRYKGSAYVQTGPAIGRSVSRILCHSIPQIETLPEPAQVEQGSEGCELTMATRYVTDRGPL